MALTTNDLTRSRVINVLTYSSYRLILDSFETLIATNNDIRVVGRTSDLNELSETVKRVKPAVVVLCLMENEWHNIEIIESLRLANPGVKTLVVTCHDDMDGHLRALELGADGLLHKNQDGRMLASAIRQINNGETWFNQKLIARAFNKDAGRRNQEDKPGFGVDPVTKREFEIVGLIARGMRNKAIASELKISEATVRHHLSSIYGKLGVEDRLNLVIYAYQNRLID